MENQICPHPIFGHLKDVLSILDGCIGLLEEVPIPGHPILGYLIDLVHEVLRGITEQLSKSP